MHCTVKMTEDLYWVGASDRRLALFESVYPIPRGVSYNAYVLLDEKTVLLDTVDNSVSPIFFENLAHVLNGRKLDYLIVNHMEPLFSATARWTTSSCTTWSRTTPRRSRRPCAVIPRRRSSATRRSAT